MSTKLYPAQRTRAQERTEIEGRSGRVPFGRIRPDEHAACVLDERDGARRVFEVQDQVLRGVVVGEVEGLCDGRGLDDDALRYRLPHDVDAR